MPYATVEELRAEGVTVAMASDERLARLLDEASAEIDHVTGWFFEPRVLTLSLDGRGTPTLELPVPLIRLDALSVQSDPVDHSRVAVVGAPVLPGFGAPRLTLLGGVFPRGAGNVIVSGVWGYTEPDGTEFGRTPPVIRRATMLLALRWLQPLGTTDSTSTRNEWRVVRERTRDQEIQFASPDASRASRDGCGDPEVDGLLARYRRPAAMGAV